MDGGRRRGLNGCSIGSSFRQNDALVFQWEAGPALCIFFHLALGDNNGTERFGSMQPVFHVGKDARETQVVLWGWYGWLG